MIGIFNATDDDRLAARLMAGIVIILTRHADDVRRDLRLMQALESWQDSLINYTRMRDLTMAFLRALDTDRVNDKIRKDFIPSFKNIKPEDLKKITEGMQGMEQGDGDYNPEWEEMLRKSGLEKKLREMTEMQSEGADVMMIPFSQLKQFPFFQKLSNWFLPFNPRHSQLTGLHALNAPTFEEFLMSESPVCDSDKYSLALAIDRMPEAARKSMASQMEQGMEQLKEATKEQRLHDTNPVFNREVDRYMRDLYRFFNLYRLKHEYANPFQTPPDFQGLPVVGEWVAEPEMLKLISEFYFKRGYWREALALFHRMADPTAPDIHLLEKTGYCLQKLGDIPGALDCYREAEALGDTSPWLLRAMATALKKASDHRGAADYYGRLLETDSENVNLIYRHAASLFAAGDYAAAASALYKADYLRADDTRTLRLLALALLMRDEEGRAKARTLAARLIDEYEDTEERDNEFTAGLVAAVTKDYPAAIRHFKAFESDTALCREKASLRLDDLNLQHLRPDIALILELARL